MQITELRNLLAAKTGSEPKTSGKGFVCRCPAHDDHNASLSVSEGLAGLLLKCHAGCRFDSIAAALGIPPKEFFHQNGTATKNGANGTSSRLPRAKSSEADTGRKWKLVESYSYNDAIGKLLFQVCRYDPKDFRQRRPDPGTPGKWIWQMKGTQLVTYRLPELLAAAKSGETLFIVEGEKDVAAMVAHGFPATCNPGGAGKWKDDFAQYFAGAKAVRIIADKDKPDPKNPKKKPAGQPHAADVAASLAGKVPSVKVFELPDVDGKPVKDAHDFFAAGGTAAQLRELAEAAKEFEPTTAAPAQTEIVFRFFYLKAGNYWRQRRKPFSDYIQTTETDLKRHMKLAGILVDGWATNGTTEFEKAICEAQEIAAVDTVISLAGHQAGIFVSDDGSRILVPHGPKIIEPKPGPIDVCEKFFTELWGPEQLPYGLSWLKIMLEDLRTLNPKAWRHHQMLAMVGAANCGKSWCQNLITMLLGGRQTDPYNAMIGKENFNEHIATSEHLWMEDKNAQRDAKSRGEFGAAIKRLTVSSVTSIRGLYKTQISAPCFHRITMSINDDSDYITALPMLDDSVSDKLHLFKCSQAAMPENYAENRANFERELPAFTHFLLNGWRIPEALLEDEGEKRFGVRHYHHPEVLELLDQFEPYLRFKEILDGTVKREAWPLDGITANDICNLLANGPSSQSASKVCGNSIVCGLHLKRLAADEPKRFRRHPVSRGIVRWTITAP